MAEPGEDAALVVDLIGFLAQAMIFAGVFQQHYILLGAAGDVVQLDALVEKHGAVAVADLDEQWRSHILHAEDGGVANVGLEILVERHLHALLAGFNVIGFGDAGAPVVVAVVADEIRDGSALPRRRRNPSYVWRDRQSRILPRSDP